MDGPLFWNIGESIPINIFLADPGSGAGLTGKAGFITLTVKRLSDNFYWDGNFWNITPSHLPLTETDPINEPGRYNYDLPALANTQATKYIAFSHVEIPQLIVADDMEVHVSRDLVIDVYASSPG